MKEFGTKKTPTPRLNGTGASKQNEKPTLNKYSWKPCGYSFNLLTPYKRFSESNDFRNSVKILLKNA